MTSLWRHNFLKNGPNDFIFGQKLDITKIFISCKLYENLTNSDVIMTSLRFHRNMTSLWRNYDTILTWRSILYSLLKWTFPKLKNEGLTIPTRRFPEKLWAFFDMLVFDVIDVIVTSLWRHFDVITIIFHLILIFRGYLVVMPSFISICPFSGLWHPEGKFTPPLTESDVPNHPNGIGLRQINYPKGEWVYHKDQSRGPIQGNFRNLKYSTDF